VPSGFHLRRAGAGRRGKENRKIAEKRVKTACFDDGSKKPAATPVETTSDGRGRRRPTRRRNRRRSGPVGRKVRFEKRTGKSRKFDDSGATTFGTVGGPVAVDAERRNSAVGRGDASATTPENFVPIGRAVRTPGTLARDHPPSVARGDRNANRRGPSSNASPAGHGRKPNKKKKNRENRRRRSKVIDDFASVENRVRSKTSVRTHVTTATRSGIGPRSSRQRRRWRSGQSVGLSSRRWQVRFRGRTFLFFLQSRFATKAKSRKRIDNYSQPLPSVYSSTVHKTKYTLCGYIQESSIATCGGHCTTTTSRKIKPEIASSAV
jgi:hypothetical protein